MTYKDLLSKFTVKEGDEATYVKMIEAYRQYIGDYFGWDNTLEDVAEAREHDFLIDCETLDENKTTFLHYYDPDEIELVVTPDGRVLDTDDEEIREYTKYFY